MDPVFLSLVSAGTALVASIAGPFVTLAVARRQFNASVLSANRQKWIETLRERLAELISLLVTAMVVKASWQGEWNKGMGVLAANPQMREKLQRIVLLEWNIRLLINPTEPDHQQLFGAIETVLARIRDDESDEAAMQADIDAITKLAQSILKREWQRVKRGV